MHSLAALQAGGVYMSHMYLYKIEQLLVLYWALYSTGWIVQAPGTVHVKSLDTHSALNSALLRQTPL